MSVSGTKHITFISQSYIFIIYSNVSSFSSLFFRKSEIRLKFQQFDQNADGFITRDEAHEVLFKELGFTEEKSHSLVGQFDVNSDGKLSYEEFVAFYQKVKER